MRDVGQPREPPNGRRGARRPCRAGERAEVAGGQGGARGTGGGAGNRGGAGAGGRGSRGRIGRPGTEPSRASGPAHGGGESGKQTEPRVSSGGVPPRRRPRPPPRPPPGWASPGGDERGGEAVPERALSAGLPRARGPRDRPGRPLPAPRGAAGRLLETTFEQRELPDGPDGARHPGAAQVGRPRATTRGSTRPSPGSARSRSTGPTPWRSCSWPSTPGTGPATPTFVEEQVDRYGNRRGGAPLRGEHHEGGPRVDEGGGAFLLRNQQRRALALPPGRLRPLEHAVRAARAEGRLPLRGRTSPTRSGSTASSSSSATSRPRARGGRAGERGPRRVPDRVGGEGEGAGVPLRGGTEPPGA